MKRLPALVLLLGIAACRARSGGAPISGAGAAPAPSNAFAANPLWDDGRAEIDAYDAVTRRYGHLRPFTAYHIVVKEDFSRRQLVKADPGHDPSDLVAVLKLNQVLQYQTGIYSYHQMASTFYDRATMELLKFSLTSFEWCGNSYKEFTRRPEGARLHVHTYWDNQAEATYDLPAGPDLVLYDQLPLWIRSLPQEIGTVRTLLLVPGQIESKGPRPEPIETRLRATGEEELRLPAGAYRTLRWELEGNDGQRDLYWTARDFPYLLVAWNKPDGGSLRLKWTRRLPYWLLHNPGDEDYLKRSSVQGSP